MKKFFTVILFVLLISVINPMNCRAELLTVKQGETLSSIAEGCFLSVEKLKEINKLKSDKLHFGQEIIVITKKEWGEELLWWSEKIKSDSTIPLDVVIWIDSFSKKLEQEEKLDAFLSLIYKKENIQEALSPKFINS